MGQFNIEFHPRTAIKGQVLADFTVKMSVNLEAKELPKALTWVAYVDGSSANGRSGAGVVLMSPNRENFSYAIKFEFSATNNKAEYEAVLSALSMAREMGITSVEFQSVSRVIVEQINGSFTTQEERMSQYLERVYQLHQYFDKVVLTKIPRDENSLADALSRIGSGTDLVAPVGSCEFLVKAHPTVSMTVEMMQIDEAEPEWAAEIVQYLKTGELPLVKEEAREVVRHSALYVLVGEILYRRRYSFSLLELKCW